MGQALPFCVPCENKTGCDDCIELHNWIMEKLGAVNVVRCKDCKDCIEGYCAAEIDGIVRLRSVKEDDFCSYGERRTDDD